MTSFNMSILWGRILMNAVWLLKPNLIGLLIKVVHFIVSHKKEMKGGKERERERKGGRGREGRRERPACFYVNQYYQSLLCKLGLVIFGSYRLI